MGSHFTHQCASITLTFHQHELSFHTASIGGAGGWLRVLAETFFLNKHLHFFLDILKTSPRREISLAQKTTWLHRGLLGIHPRDSKHMFTLLYRYPCPPLTEAMTEFQANHHYSVTRLIWLLRQRGSPVMDYKGSGAALKDWETTQRKLWL